ncbi:MAG: peptidoglycan DD-metalloendopeptidase family protein [Thermoanaerobaculia bacterium]|nr:peptidoglycan DD-metalloendopeptidase family protein [Thermoanaerobaculia bacterium]
MREAGRIARGAVLAACVALALGGSPAWPQEPDREAELEEIRAEIARLQARSLRLRDRQAGLAGELERTGIQLALQGKRVEEVRARRAIVEERLEAAEETIAGLEGEIAAARAELRRRLVELYRLGRDGALRLLLSIRSRQQLLPGIRLLRYLALREGRTVEEFLDLRVRLSFQRDEAERHRRQVDALLASEDQRLVELRRAQRRQELLLASLDRERESLSRRTERLEEKERKLASFLDLLYGRNPGRLGGTPIQQFRGVLDWPVRGSVTAPFGPRLDPRYGTKVPHNGVDIATSTGSEVRVVFPGKVLFAAPFQGFGPTAVVHHPERVFTLYAGLSELQVVRDDMLSLQQVVGVAGDRLYFEIRVENRPEDPLDWLR